MDGIEFVSEKGNRYVYDDNSGQIFPTYGRDPHAVLDEYNRKLGKGIELPIVKIKASDVEDFNVRQGRGFRQLILNVTDDCNFRCKYCCFSDHYELMRDYRKKQMSKETAEKAIDMYFTNLKEVRKTNPLIESFIGFYGGEPLLNMEIIKHSVKYVKLKYGDQKVVYNTTTNGYLLDEENADFLVENNFSILVSIDGDKKDHDRNRITIQGEGTFDVIMKNVNRLLQKYLDYPTISASACFDFRTNLSEVEIFFENVNIPIVKFSIIDQTDTTYYKMFTDEDVESFKKQIDQTWKKIMKLVQEREFKGDRFLFRAFGVGYLELSYHCMIGDSKNHLIPYSGSCIPGEKLMVASNGDIHICEKINQYFPIGNVKSGIDYQKIAKYINEYNEVVCVNCKDCKVKRLCSICFTKFSKDGRFEYSHSVCESFVNSMIRVLSEYVTILEEDPTLADELTVRYYDNIINRKIGRC